MYPQHGIICTLLASRPSLYCSSRWGGGGTARDPRIPAAGAARGEQCRRRLYSTTESSQNK